MPFGPVSEECRILAATSSTAPSRHIAFALFDQRVLQFECKPGQPVRDLLPLDGGQQGRDLLIQALDCLGA